jgi:hypothetical protein
LRANRPKLRHELGLAIAEQAFSTASQVISGLSSDGIRARDQTMSVSDAPNSSAVSAILLVISSL